MLQAGCPWSAASGAAQSFRAKQRGCIVEMVLTLERTMLTVAQLC